MGQKNRYVKGTSKQISLRGHRLYENDTKLVIFSDENFNNCGLLRLDLRSDYETEKHIVSILDIIVPKEKELFECNWIATKVIPTAESRVLALKKYGVGLSEEVIIEFDGTKYGFYYTLEVKIMVIEKCKKESFVVIGKEGSTSDGEGFIQKLWDDANSHFGEIQHLAKKDENGNLVGIWGAMSDFSRSFEPWEDFSKGLYLAGAECIDGTEVPKGWTKWIIPAYEYIRAERESDNTFSEVIKYLEDNDITLAGAVHDFTCPKNGKGYMFFPIKKL